MTNANHLPFAQSSRPRNTELDAAQQVSHATPTRPDAINPIFNTTPAEPDAAGRDSNDTVLPVMRLFDSLDPNDPLPALKTALKHFGSGIALASSFSLEDVALIDMMIKLDSKARILALDTGRLSEESYECAEKIRLKYSCEIEWLFPDRERVELLIREKGLFSFKESLENRHECCFIRKVLPLERALSGLDAWITGQRRQQSITRANIQVVEIDEAHGQILKLNPLAYWSLEQVKAYVQLNNVPYNRLYELGYQSIGCAPCTRPSQASEDERAGRWWWENAAHKECGIHLANRKILE